MMPNEAMQLILQLGIQFSFMVLFFMERSAHESTRKELHRVLLKLAAIPPDDDLEELSLNGRTGQTMK